MSMCAHRCRRYQNGLQFITIYLTYDDMYHASHLVRVNLSSWTVDINYLFTTAYVNPTIKDNLIVPIHNKTILKY